MINTDKNYDVIVVGGGHNGLVCANYLAKDGRKVLIVEANDSLGGASATSPLNDEFSVSSCAHWLFQLNPTVASDMGLTKHGLVQVSYTHLRAQETVLDLVCRLLLEKKKKQTKQCLIHVSVPTPPY